MNKKIRYKKKIYVDDYCYVLKPWVEQEGIVEEALEWVEVVQAPFDASCAG